MDEMEIAIREIGFALMKARKINKLTQSGLAEKCNSSSMVICNIECGKYNPSIKNLLKILHSIGYTLKVVPKDGDDSFR